MVPPDQPGAVCTIRWVLKDDFGKGPFRWVVYGTRGGAMWGITDPFYLPTYAGDWVLSDAVPLSPAIRPIGSPLLPSPSGRPCSGVHTVHTGENLFRIAYSCNLTTASLAAANGLHFPYIIYPGQTLRYP